MKRMGRTGRFSVILLTLLTVFGTLPAAAFGAAPDIAGHWAETVMQKWIDDGSLSGYGDGVYRPNANITRAEFMAFVNRMNGYTELSAGLDAYKDVDPSAWYYNDVSRALAAGYVNGTSDTTMSPDSGITRQEAMTMVLKSKGIAAAQETSVLAGTNDGESAADWAKGYVAAAVENGLVSGSGGSVSPLARITRAETVTLLDRVKTDTRTYAFAGEFGPASGTQTVKSVVISASGANLKNTTVTGDLEIAAAVGNGDVTLANVKVNGNLYVNGGGANTILFNNVDVLGSVVVNKTGGGVRILATGSTNVRLTILESGAVLVERDLTGGGFERVEISADLTAGQPVVLEGQFTAVENNAANLDFTVNGRVNELISSEDLTVKGTGVIAKLTPADGAAITNETTETAPAPATGGGGGGGNNTGEVVPAHIGALLSKFDANAATDAFSVDVADASNILANGASVNIGGLQNAGGTNAYYAYIKGGAATDTAAKVPVVLTVTGANGAVVNNIAEFAVALEPVGGGASMMSGAYIADDAIASGSAILLFDFSAETKYFINVSDSTGTVNYTPLSLTLYYVPEGAKTLEAVTVTGDALIGGTLEAGTVTADGGTVTTGFTYQWLRSRYANEAYDAIAGAIAESYSPVESDKGYYIRLKVTGDGQALYGETISGAKGPVTSIVEQEGTDARFKQGYPRSYIKENTIWVEFELNTAAQVYMLVNASNGQLETNDPQSVLNGYAEDTEYPVWVDDSPVFFTAADSKVTYDTGVGFWSGQEARLHFVLTDRDDRTKDIGNVVTVHYDVATVSELDEDGPSVRKVFLNAARSAIYIYFDEAIATAGLAASDFILSNGTVTSAEIHNYGGAAIENYRGAPTASYVRLLVSGISDADNLYVEYAGETVTDISVNKNKAESFNAHPEPAATSVESVYIGNDGKSLAIEVSGGLNIEEFFAHNEWDDMYDFFTFIQNGSEIKASDLEFGYLVGGISYMLKFDVTLNGSLEVTYNPASAPNWAYDTENAITHDVDGDMSAVNSAPTSIRYSKSEGALILEYPAGFMIDMGADLADGFTAEIDGVNYRLRGFNIYGYGGYNTFMISMDVENDAYMRYIARLLDNAQGATLSYSAAHPHVYNQLLDIGGALLPSFSPVNVDIQN
jgi:hypothetical protein